MSTHITLSNRYRLVSPLGQGGMAKVYLATDLLLNREVAVKMLHERFAGDREFVERFRREAQAAASLSHPNIVNIYDVGEDHSTHYIVLEYVKGRNLKDILRRQGRLPIRQATFVARAVAAALSAAHRQGLVHRDVKPHNILITDEGRVKVTDFGIARAASASTLTQTGTLIGSVHYFSPEQAQGLPTGPQTDVYSLGVVLYEMLTGQVPFTSDTPVAIALKHIQEPPKAPSALRPGLPEALENIVLRALEKDTTKRYPSAEHVFADLRAFSRSYAGMKAETGAGAAASPFGDEDHGMWGEDDGGPFAGSSISQSSGASRVQTGSIRLGDTKGGGPVQSGGDEPPGEINDDGPTRIMRAVDEPTRVMSSYEFVERAAPAAETDRPVPKPRLRRRWLSVAVLLLFVYVGISRGTPLVMDWIFPPEVQVPDVVGLHLDEARERLRQSGLDMTLERRVHHPEVPEFHVIAQQPDPQRTVKMRRAIQVTMSLGPEFGAVPDVRGLTEREARLVLTQQGFVLGDVVDEYRPDLQPQQVFHQVPSPNESWERGSPISLWVARTGPEFTRVALPDFRGLTLDEMRAKMQELGLREGHLWPEPAARLPAGYIIDQNPGPGEEVEVGGEVAFVYSEPAADGDGGQAVAEEPQVPRASATQAREREPVVRRHAEVPVYVPEGFAQEVVIVVIDDFGAREVFRDTMPGGTQFSQPIEARGNDPRVQVYIGGAMVKDVGIGD